MKWMTIKVNITHTNAESPTNNIELSIPVAFFCPAANKALPTAAISAKRKMEELFIISPLDVPTGYALTYLFSLKNTNEFLLSDFI